MLQAIRDRAQGIFAWVMLIAIGIPFALWGIQNYIETGKEKPYAVVGDREIFERDVSRAYEQNLARFIGMDDFDEKELRRQSLEQVIGQEVLIQSAEARTLVVSDAEIRENIQSIPEFQTELKFDKDKYKALLASARITPDQFVSGKRRELLQEQFHQGVADSNFVLASELDDFLRLLNQERELEYTSIIPLPVSKIPEEKAIQDYYAKHVQDFEIPEKISVDYLVLSLDEIARNIKIDDTELLRLYEEQKSNFVIPERRKVSHILISFDGKGIESETRAKDRAMTIRERLARGEDFAAIAREASGDGDSAKKGGDLGYLNKGGQEESFTRAAEVLGLGQVSEPVKTSFGYHLIKVTELAPERTRSFAEVKDELVKATQRNRAETEFYERGQKLAELTFEHPDSLELAAQSLGLDIQHTELFTREQGEGLAVEESVRKVAFSQEVMGGRNSEPVELGSDRALVLRKRSHEPASRKPLTEVKDMIVDRIREDEARADAERRALDLLDRARRAGGLVDVARANGLGVLKTGPIRRDNATLPKEFVRKAFEIGRPSDGKSIYEMAVLPDGTRIVFTLTTIKEAPKDEKASADKEQEKASAKQYMTRSGGQAEFEAFVGRLRDLLEVEVIKGD